MAQKACEQLNGTMATHKQVEVAYSKKMETCRNGWISNVSTAILRHSHHENCAGNTTGVVFNSRVDVNDLFDAYCYDEKDGLGKNCKHKFRIRGEAPSDEPAEPSLRPETLTTTGDEFDSGITMKPQSEDADGEGKQLTVTPGENALDVTGGTTATTVDFGDSGLFGRSDNTVGPTFTSADVDLYLGSGIQPTEEEDVTTAVKPPEEGQPPTGDETMDNPTETTPQHANGKGGVLAPVDEQQKRNDSTNWIVVLAVIVAVAVILLVCVAVAKRKSWCGRSQSLMITKDGEGNGAAASASRSHSQEREQEMVTLMNKEKVQENGNTEEFTVITLEETSDKEQMP
ncbi:uncharacterized protein KZ484_009920 isoform 2-T2 [Pholidichthys leucotaenia]